MRFTRGIRSSIPRFPISAVQRTGCLPCQGKRKSKPYSPLCPPRRSRRSEGVLDRYQNRSAGSLIDCASSVCQVNVHKRTRTLLYVEHRRGEEDEDDLLRFLRRDHCSSPDAPLGGDTAALSLLSSSTLHQILTFQRPFGIKSQLHVERSESKTWSPFLALRPKLRYYAVTVLSMVLRLLAPWTEVRGSFCVCCTRLVHYAWFNNEVQNI